MKIKMLNRLGGMRDLVGYALVAAIIQASEKSNPPHMGIPKEFSMDEDGCLDVQFLVNGVEVPFEFLMERWEREIDKRVNKQALRVIESRFSNISQVISELGEEVKRSARELFPDKDW